MFKKKKTVDVVIVEDNEQNRLLLRDLIEINGFSSLCFKTGEDAVDYFKNNIAKVILLDIFLPKMDGFQVLSYIRADNQLKHTKVAAVTALAVEEQINKIKKVGFDAYFVKPLNMGVLVKHVAKWCENSYEK